MTDKVIQFPKHKVVRDIPEEVHKARQAKADQKLADSIIDEITGMIVTELDNYYVEVTDKQFAKDFILVIDALKASIYRSFGIDHHLHDFIDKNVTLIGDNFENLTNEEIVEKIDQIMKELEDAKNRVDVAIEDDE